MSVVGEETNSQESSTQSPDDWLTDNKEQGGSTFVLHILFLEFFFSFRSTNVNYYQPSFDLIDFEKLFISVTWCSAHLLTKKTPFNFRSIS